MIILRNKPRVYILIGIPGSGKSTWAKKEHPNLPVVSRDIIRYELGFTSGPNEKKRLDNKQEDEVTRLENEYILRHLKNKEDFIIDDTNLKRKYRKELIKLLRDNNAFIIGVNFKTPLNVCIKRRQSQISPDIIKNMYNRMEKLDKNEVDKIINI